MKFQVSNRVFTMKKVKNMFVILLLSMSLFLGSLATVSASDTVIPDITSTSSNEENNISAGSGGGGGGTGSGGGPLGPICCDDRNY